MVTQSDRKHRYPVHRVYVLAMLLALALFYFHVVVLADVAGEMLRHKQWLTEHLGPHRMGKTVILGCFFILFAAHLTEAAAWGAFLRWTQLSSSITEGFYFTAASLTTLGYGDVVLRPPWRHLGPLAAVSGVLTFGCSTAFLFIVMQTVWQQHVYPAKDAIGGIAPYGCSGSGRREDGPMRATKGEDRDLVPFVEDVNLPDSALVRVHLSDLWEISSRFAAIALPGNP